MLMKNENILSINLDNTLNVAEYHQHFEKKASEKPAEHANTEELEHAEYTKLNLQRSSRINRTYNVSPPLKQALLSIKQPQTWVVITEPWCGDSAQILPYIEKMAAVNDCITLRIVLRDKHPEIMDRYLTNGTRSIPIVVASNAAGEEIFRWGPRPRKAAELVAALKKQGYSKAQFLEQLHLWYGRNRGKELEKEFLHLIS